MRSKWEIYENKLKTVLQENPTLIENKDWRLLADKVVLLKDSFDRKGLSNINNILL